MKYAIFFNQTIFLTLIDHSFIFDIQKGANVYGEEAEQEPTEEIGTLNLQITSVYILTISIASYVSWNFRFFSYHLVVKLSKLKLLKSHNLTFRPSLAH